MHQCQLLESDLDDEKEQEYFPEPDTREKPPMDKAGMQLLKPGFA
jgi:hypothetical protein